MNRTLYNTPRCPGSLKDGFNSYNPGTLRTLFDSRKVFHIIEGSPDTASWQKARIEGEQFGGQQWYRVALHKNKPEPHPAGNYILKIVPDDSDSVKFPFEQAGNEHFCLQLAKQVYGIDTVPNAMIFFENGQPAIIARYSDSFPFHQDEIKDFSQLINQNETQLHIDKDRFSYYDLVAVINENVAASLIGKERFFTNILFGWLVANGHAYMKNIRLRKTPLGDYTIFPLADILCTRAHAIGPEIAAPGGLYQGDKNTPEFREYGHYTRNEFSNFAMRLGINRKRSDKIMDHLVAGRNAAGKLLDQAFVPEEVKNIIRYYFNERLMRLK
ncbi:MAG: HipA domain-containing protein [Bacteroidetes bacterium]|nr:HipA domain-containing protein [Bacteroidota bacterium]